MLVQIRGWQFQVCAEWGDAPCQKADVEARFCFWESQRVGRLEPMKKSTIGKPFADEREKKK